MPTQRIKTTNFDPKKNHAKCSTGQKLEPNILSLDNIDSAKPSVQHDSCETDI